MCYDLILCIGLADAKQIQKLRHVKQAKERLQDQLQEVGSQVQQLMEDQGALLQKITTVEDDASKLRCQVSQLQHQLLQSTHLNAALP